jgi:DNA repair exonuclease SbcCD ATPase subunit
VLIFLVRQLNDVAVIEEASTHLNRRKRKQVIGEVEIDLEKQMSSLSLGKEEALAEIRSGLAEFSRLTVVFESASAKDALGAMRDLPRRLQEISKALRSLESQYQETFVKISRSIRALQRRIEKLESDYKRSDSGRGSSEWNDALNQWLLALVPCISDMLAPESTVSGRDLETLYILLIQSCLLSG